MHHDPRTTEHRSWSGTSLVPLVALTLLCAGWPGQAGAQGKKLGAYTGTVAISGSELGQEKVSYRASVKISLPLTSGNERSAMAELDDVDKPSASAVISQWDLAGRNASPDSDGKITSWTCALAAPVEVPMSGSGSLSLNYKPKTYSMFIALVARKPIPLKCVNSRSGPYKKEQLVSLFFGTSEPDLLPGKELPFADPARLTASFKLVPVSQMKGRNGPTDMEWDFKLSR